MRSIFGLLASLDVTTLNNYWTTVIFMVSKGCALRAGKEHCALCSPPFESQFQFLRNDEGQVFFTL